YASQTFPPDHDKRGKREEERHRRHAERAAKGRERRPDFEHVRTHDDHCETSGDESEGRDAARPNGEPGCGLGRKLQARHRSHEGAQMMPVCAARTVASKMAMRSLASPTFHSLRKLDCVCRARRLLVLSH